MVEEEQEKKEEEKEQRTRELEEFYEKIKLVTPGTKLRAALDEISKAGLGALIVLGDSPEVLKVISGGIKIDCKFTPEQLVELCKMDGAIVLSDDLKKIVYCNALLVPDFSIPSAETGTRHKAAEHTAKQTARPVVAISERRKTISFYYKNLKYVLKGSSEVLGEAIENLRMLEKHKEILNELLLKLNLLEFNQIAALQDAVACIQRAEIISRIADIIRRYLIELGSEGTLVALLFKEIIEGVEEEKELLVKDYSRNFEFSITALPTLTFDELLEPMAIVRVLLYSSDLEAVRPRCNRLLAKTTLPRTSKEALSKLYLDELLSLVNEPNKLNELIGEKDAKKLIKELNNLNERVVLGKKI